MSEQQQATKLVESLESRAWREFSITYRIVYSYLNSDLRQYGLTPPQYSVLRSIGTSEKGMLTMSEIGKQMVVTYANVTTVVDNLERLDYVRRIRDSVDRRCVKVKLTPKGSRLFSKIRSAHVSQIESLMKVLNEQELENLLSYTEKLRKRIV
ncbi:MAG: MarR family transcriptional regulator [Nitrososphaerota archaeon]|nr:MarR family transcriptional regulator [Nitrososphaerota archaeon]MDG6922260.1 MarR family transcriptional regulator [Nitrososphaerota archaeon]